VRAVAAARTRGGLVMAELPRPSNSGPKGRRVRAELGIARADRDVRVIVTSGNPDWLISVVSTGAQQLVATCAYRTYAAAVGTALAGALDCRMEVIT
jgi:hypothetical protein